MGSLDYHVEEAPSEKTLRDGIFLDRKLGLIYY